jgi:hypothetical protein
MLPVSLLDGVLRCGAPGRRMPLCLQQAGIGGKTRAPLNFPRAANLVGGGRVQTLALIRLLGVNGLSIK